MKSRLVSFSPYKQDAENLSEEKISTRGKLVVPKRMSSPSDSPALPVPSDHAPFKALYLDTNALLPSWPQSLPAATRQLLYEAKTLGIKVYLAAPVVSELEAHWRRENLKNIHKSAANLTQELHKLGLANIGRLPTDNELLAAYRIQAAQQQQEHGLEPAPLLQGTIEPLFTDAINHTFPFQPEGKNFPDAVILHSILQHNASLGAQPAAFLSRNKKDFDRPGVAACNKQYGTNITYFASETELSEALGQAAIDYIRALWLRNQSAAAIAINNHRHDVQAFLEQTYVKTSEVRLALRDIHDVKTFLLDPAADGKIPLSFQADAEFITALGESPPLRLTRTAIITGSGLWHDGIFTDITLESAELL